MTEKTELRNGMKIDWDVPIAMDDGLVLQADIYRPPKEGKYPGDPNLWPLRQRPRLPGGLTLPHNDPFSKTKNILS